MSVLRARKSCRHFLFNGNLYLAAYIHVCTVALMHGPLLRTILRNNYDKPTDAKGYTTYRKIKKAMCIVKSKTVGCTEWCTFISFSPLQCLYNTCVVCNVYFSMFGIHQMYST